VSIQHSAVVSNIVGGAITARRANFDYWLGRLKSNDGNNANDFIERIGEQGHYNEGNLTDIAVLGQLLQTYHTQFAIPIGITEFDVNTTDKQLQADYLRDFLTMSFSQSGVDEFVQWGFWSGKHWLPNSALYDLDFSIRPNGQVYEDLIFGNWWTDTRATTRNGAVNSEVFKGNYEITVTHGNQTITRTLNAFTADGSLTVEIDILAPTVLTLAPADNAIHVPVDSNLVLAFNDGIVRGTGDITIKRTNDNSTFAAIDISSPQVTVSNGVVTINPTVDMEGLTGYYVQIDAGAIRDLTGNAFAGISDPTTWNFTTVDLNNSPTNIALSSAIVAENLSAASTVGTFSTTDPDTSDAFAYALVSGTGSADNSSFTIDSQGNLKTESVFDFESKSSYSIRVRSTDQGGLFVERVFTITVNNVLEFNPNIQVGVGSSQRSSVRSLTLAFDNAIEFDAEAFQVFRRDRDSNGQLQLVPVATSVSLPSVAGGTTATLTFSGNQTRGSGALLDGNYQLVLNGDLIRMAGTAQTLDADRNGIQGGQHTYGAQDADRFFSL
jgi:Bacterial Ig-like domain/Cadherin domain